MAVTPNYNYETALDSVPLQNELLSFFAEGYGRKFLGLQYFLKAYVLRADGVLTMRDPCRQSLMAAQLLPNGRLTAAATMPNPPGNCHRRELMIDLLKHTRGIEPTGWTTIGHTARGMQFAAIGAGMELLTDPEDVRKRIIRFGESDEHVIAPALGGLAVSRVGSKHQTDYLQLAWGWERE